MSGSEQGNLREVGVELFWGSELSSSPASWSTAGFGFDRIAEYV